MNPNLEDLRVEVEYLKRGMEDLDKLIEGNLPCHRIVIGVGIAKDPATAESVVTLRANKFPHLDILGRQVAAAMLPMMRARYSERVKVYEEALTAELERLKG